MLASRTNKWFSFISTKLSPHVGPLIYATDVVFRGRRPRDVMQLLGAWAHLRAQQGFSSCLVHHSNFWGVTSGIHLLSFWGVDANAFHPPPALPRIPDHVVNAANPDPSREIESLCPIDEPIPRASIVRDGMLRPKGLFDVFFPSVPVACPCVFKVLGWAQQALLTKELLHIFDTPLAMDEVLLSDRRGWVVLQRAITPIVVSAIFCLLWLNSVGVDTDSVMAQQELTANKEEKMDKTDREEDIIEKQVVEEPLSQWTGRGEQLKELELFAELKEENNLAKAVKSDDVEIPRDLWDQAVCRAPPSEIKKKALTTIQDAWWHNTDDDYGWMPGSTYKTHMAMIGANPGTPRSTKT